MLFARGCVQHDKSYPPTREASVGGYEFRREYAPSRIKVRDRPRGKEIKILYRKLAWRDAVSARNAAGDPAGRSRRLSPRTAHRPDRERKRPCSRDHRRRKPEHLAIAATAARSSASPNGGTFLLLLFCRRCASVAGVRLVQSTPHGRWRMRSGHAQFHARQTTLHIISALMMYLFDWGSKSKEYDCHSGNEPVV